jgi:L-2,4-diaminobutyric acid acetyltransferase
MDIQFREPNAADTMPLHQLIQSCPPLDTNSSYCNLLQVHHFADTAVVATNGNELVGSVTGYRIPSRADTLFIWQVAVSEKARGQKLAEQMLLQILDRPALSDIRYLETTVTPDNAASRKVFTRLAERLNTELDTTEQAFHRDQHFQEQHDSEDLFRIGPFHAA